MTKSLKERIKEEFNARCEEEGFADLLDKIADETNAEESEKLLEYLSSTGHPALEMDPMF